MSRIRRPNFRKPFGTKRAKRPTRWIDANSNPASDCQYIGDAISCLPTIGKDLIFGDLDMDWSDKSEVTLSRLVGNLSWTCSSSTTQVVPLSVERGIPNQRVLVRAGILVREEVDAFAGTDPIDLFDPESIEEYEWMWLNQHQVLFHGDGWYSPSGLPNELVITSVSQWDVDLDLRVKRRLGKKDHLVLFRQWAAGPGAFDVTVLGATLLRELMMS